MSTPRSPDAGAPDREPPAKGTENAVDEAVDEFLPGERSAELDPDPHRPPLPARSACEGARHRHAAPESAGQAALSLALPAGRARA